MVFFFKSRERKWNTCSGFWVFFFLFLLFFFYIYNLIFNVGKQFQDISSTSSKDNVTTKVAWTGTKSDNLVTFDGGYQITFLPGGIYMGCPCDVAKSVAELKSFHLEFCWLESPGKRQRLVRTYDVEGLAVSSTYFYETRIWTLIHLQIATFYLG